MRRHELTNSEEPAPDEHPSHDPFGAMTGRAGRLPVLPLTVFGIAKTFVLATTLR